jgi:RNA polymerase sigma factor (sigma-70 family)
MRPPRFPGPGNASRPVIRLPLSSHSEVYKQAMAAGGIEDELERLHVPGFAWALACCERNREEAEDVLQTSYLKILDGRAKFEGYSSLKTFLFGVIRRTASEARRRNAFRRVFLADWGGRADHSPTPEPEERLTLLSALARLPGRQRQVLELVFYLGMTVEEAAETLAISVGSARVHYHRGKRLAAKLVGVRRGS